MIKFLKGLNEENGKLWRETEVLRRESIVACTVSEKARLEYYKAKTEYYKRPIWIL